MSSTTFTPPGQSNAHLACIPFGVFLTYLTAGLALPVISQLVHQSPRLNNVIAARKARQSRLRQ
ncbi:hypothetical protein SAMN05216516_10564 [Izhakiella capsodis]|uniref:Uncharacterized protein n=1 Tax=Izhakiella capsodis TaxID=1367852 RepID=A0A1I4XX63_9GAMM|nr:hypothetical protein SAMN05216516_10564 [Izhakiella capsodis]